MERDDDDNEANDDDEFGDDFDDFEEGNEDDDFDDFEDGFQEAETPAPVAASQPTPQSTLPFVSSSPGMCGRLATDHYSAHTRL